MNLTNPPDTDEVAEEDVLGAGALGEALLHLPFMTPDVHPGSPGKPQLPVATGYMYTYTSGLDTCTPKPLATCTLTPLAIIYVNLHLWP